MQHTTKPRSTLVPRTVLTIAGHDPSSGAGITADLQTFAAHGLFGTSAITALTVQSTLGVADSQSVSPDLLGRAVEHLCADLPPAGIKIGMLGSEDIVSTVADLLARLRETPQGLAIPVVLDPVLRASSGAVLLPEQALQAMRARLLTLVNWVTPNWGELAALAEHPAGSAEQALNAMSLLGRRFPQLSIVATGGDQEEPTDLLREPAGDIHSFRGEHIPTTSTHGTGCAFSSALLSRLVLGDDAVQAVRAAKSFVATALRAAPGIGGGRGPLNLLWPLNENSGS